MIRMSSALAIGAVALTLVLVTLLYQLYQYCHVVKKAGSGLEMNAVQLHTPRT